MNSTSRAREGSKGTRGSLGIRGTREIGGIKGIGGLVLGSMGGTGRILGRARGRMKGLVGIFAIGILVRGNVCAAVSSLGPRIAYVLSE